ncbi:HEPN domain-containing protein [Candidatus Parcubacteria bacterium]|nr:HEPN domain-containing protein [Candidatus Parcubacteria bacterium]
MKKKINKWLPYIEADLNIADIGLHDKKANKWTHLSIVWHCHQATEKSLKMYVIAQGKELLPIHDLVRLIRYADLKDMDKSQIDFIYSLNKYYITPRYPDLPLAKSYIPADKKIAEYYFNKSKEFFLWIKKIIKTDLK